jgi:hypothetical protein
VELAQTVELTLIPDFFNPLLDEFYRYFDRHHQPFRYRGCNRIPLIFTSQPALASPL